MNPRETEEQIARLWNFDDPAASAAAFAAAADAEPDADAAAVLRTQQARAVGLAGDLDQAAGILDGLAPGSDHLGARLAIERGRVCNSTGRPEQARPLFERAVAAARSAGLPALALDAEHMLAIVAGQLDGPQAAITLGEQSVARARDSTDPAARAWLGSLLNNLGWALVDAGRFDDAVPAFQQALQARIDAGQHTRIEQARQALDEVRMLAARAADQDAEGDA